MKIVINDCYGGFSVSKAVYDYLGLPWDGHGFLQYDLALLGLSGEDAQRALRTYPKLIEAIETLGTEQASGKMAKLKIVEIPDDVTDWWINEYDGLEEVCEGRRWS